MTGDEYIEQVCRIGQRGACCRYLACGKDGIECLKLNPSWKAAIDAKVSTMSAQADNCPGQTGTSDTWKPLVVQ